MALNPPAELSAGARSHLHRLVASWDMLADFCFSDLVLYVPRGDDEFVMFSHIRPTTSQTIYHQDLVGEVRSADQRPLVARAFEAGEVATGDIDSVWLDGRIRVLCIPVRFDGTVVAVLARESAQSYRVQFGELERVYLQVFDRFAAMLAAGTFPFEEEEVHLANPPRVGDGVTVAVAMGHITYTSPNATSALTRSGVKGNLRGQSLLDGGLEWAAVAAAFATGQPGVDEIDMASGATIAVRALPLLDAGAVTGAVVLLRDISEVRSRDRLLLSKDATIREIHHRVKNNLQTISSLLRLHGRRLTEPSAKAAIEESVRRIRSIALVHETLSREAGDDVPFTQVLRPLLRMVEEGLVSPERPVRFVIGGDAGVVASPIATSLAVVLTELLQNVVEHAYPASLDLGDETATVHVELRNDGERLTVSVIDDGVGLPDEFDEAAATSLGLTIVRTLVRSEMAGTIELHRGDGRPPRGGTTVVLEIPLSP